MRVSPEGNARFARQENGQVFADGDGQKAGTVSRVAVVILAITGIICLSLDQYAAHKHQIDLYHTAFYYHNSLSV